RGFGRTRSDQKHQHDRDDCETGKYPKHDRVRYLAIPQRAKAPVRKPSTADSNEIHDSIACRAQFRPHDLAEDRHVVTIEEPPPKPEEREEKDGHPQGPGVTDAKQGWDQQAHPERADKDPAPFAPA